VRPQQTLLPLQLPHSVPDCHRGQRSRHAAGQAHAAPGVTVMCMWAGAEGCQATLDEVLGRQLQLVNQGLGLRST